MNIGFNGFHGYGMELPMGYRWEKMVKGVCWDIPAFTVAVIVFLLIFKVDLFTLPVMFYVMEILDFCFCPELSMSKFGLDKRVLFF